MKVEDVEPGTMVRFGSGRTGVVGNRDDRTDVFCQGFETVEQYEKSEKMGMMRLDAEVEIVDDN